MLKQKCGSRQLQGIVSYPQSPQWALMAGKNNLPAGLESCFCYKVVAKSLKPSVPPFFIN